MLNSLKIGIFDSGLGGLTVFKSLKDKFPSCSFIYLGDLAHLPYGEKSSKAIINYSKKIIEFFLKHKVDLIVVACNSASSVALKTLKKEYIDVDIIGVINPSVALSVQFSKTRSIGLIGTQTTINSKSYDKQLLSLIDQKFKLHAIACPLFVPIVEEGWEDTDIAYQIATKYLIHFNNTNIDTVILGCTHYPILINTLKSVFKKLGHNKLNFIDCGEAVSLYLESQIKLNNSNSNQSDQFYVTDTSHQFNELASKFLGYTIPKIEIISL
tara:strand:+ start:3692 stop:4498 length:807 start_codon:yes stop_codon:yes gene_type:complete